ncbi:beta-phosphoglucomutase [Ornithinibacillus halophilus]|uniref:Beta-phosphoglucomutase n=1 Tax=Ornithinibacillus halophilus TaxID=930117 RepID=A0A1M5FU46_9BACI|nr:beta-phosphoglucomutase [Ornithinibacillus halophilus]SHF94949.1 beta-phosphoglucomutase [Ornithinibacillus halophilus]
MTNPKAFIFDLDGVITDTAEFHYQAWKQLAEELGIHIDREFNEQLKGISRMDSLDRILALDSSYQSLAAEEKEGLATKKNEHYKQLMQAITPEHILPGIKDFLDTIKSNKIEIALASASKNAPMILEQLQLSDYFRYIVDPAKLSNGKPDPEIFTTAADFLSVDYSECIGVEDAASGVQAINAASMFSVGVGDKEVLAAADMVVEDTTGLDFNKIIEAFRQARN